MSDIVILNNIGKNSKDQIFYVDTYLFKADQKAKKGNMSKVYKGYRLSDIRIALNNGTLTLPTAEFLQMKGYLQPKIILVASKSQSAKTRALHREFQIVEESDVVKPIAIKVLFGDLAKIPMYRDRFVRETRIKIEHPNVVQIIDYVLIPDGTHGKHHIIMEFLNGRTLEDMLSEDKKVFGETEALEIVRQVLMGLEAVHSEGELTHRDIKSGNIMRCNDGIVKIIDFGIAKLDQDETEKRLTGIATFIGTLAYASPEQVKMFNVGKQTDIWSTGVVLYEILSSELPFTGLNDDESKRKILEDPTPQLTHVSEAVNKIIQKATSKDLNSRYQTAQDFITDIDIVLQPVPEKKRNPVSTGAVVSIMVTLVIILIFYFLFSTKFIQ